MNHPHLKEEGRLGKWQERSQEMGICIRYSYLHLEQSGEAKYGPLACSQTHPTYAPTPPEVGFAEQPEKPRCLFPHPTQVM